MQGIYDEEAIPKLDRRSDHVERTNRRNTKQLFISRSNKDIRANFFTRRVAPVWNLLPEEIVTAPSVNSFKNKLDKLWDNHPMKYDYKNQV